MTTPLFSMKPSGNQHKGATLSRAMVLNFLRLKDHLQILSLGRRPPLKILPGKIAKIGLFVGLSTVIRVHV